jgi:Domain of unknown function (DUF1877)
MSMILNLFRANSTELAAYLSDSQTFANRVYDDETPDLRRADIDKSWDGIVYLLTGAPLHAEVNELYRALFNHTLIDEKQEIGYGSATYLTPEEVVYFNEKLANITKNDLQANFDTEKMMQAEIYPEIWRNNESSFDYLFHYFEQLKAFYAKAAAENEAIITLLA